MIDNHLLQHYLDRVAAFIAAHHYDRLDLRAALVDMDGTLYDSMPRHADAWMQMCCENGLEARREEFFAWEGRTGASSIGIIMRRQFGRDATPDEVERLYRRKTECFVAMPSVDVMPSAPRLLAELRSRGLECVLVTGSGQSSLISRLERDYPGVFAPDRRITSRDVQHGKPAPEPYLRAMALAGVQPHQAVVIENAPLGVRSGASSGALTVGVLTGPIPRTDMEKAGATLLFDSMEQCADYLPLIIDRISLKA